MSATSNKTGEMFTNTLTYRSPADVAIAKGVIIGTNGSSKAVIAQTDATAVVGEAITADSCAAGEYPSVYAFDGSIGQILGGDTSAAGTHVTTGISTDLGRPIAAAAGAGKPIFAELLEAAAVGVLTKARMVKYETGA